MSIPDTAVVPSFTELFGAEPDATADAPGRVNLIGDHTDYHDGFVLPSAIPQRTRAQVRRRTDLRVLAWSGEAGNQVGKYEIGHETRGRGWLDYVQGVTSALAAAGRRVQGFDLRIDSNVPVGSGLSSSAALEVGLLRALRDAFHMSLDDVELARIGQRAETDFVGAPIGVMDQMAASLACEGEALFLDTRSLAFERVTFPHHMELIVVDSGVAHQHAGGEYARRRGESFAAASVLGVERLRELSVDALPRIERLPDILARRARHVVTENQRVIDAVAALRMGDVARLGLLFNASHASMRDDYQTSTAEIDVLVDIGQQDPDVYGARLTGGGFGGAVVMLARSGGGRAAAARTVERYRSQTGRNGVIQLPLP